MQDGSSRITHGHQVGDFRHGWRDVNSAGHFLLLILTITLLNTANKQKDAFLVYTTKSIYYQIAGQQPNKPITDTCDPSFVLIHHTPILPVCYRLQGISQPSTTDQLFRLCSFSLIRKPCPGAVKNLMRSQRERYLCSTRTSVYLGCLPQGYIHAAFHCLPLKSRAVALNHCDELRIVDLDVLEIYRKRSLHMRSLFCLQRKNKIPCNTTKGCSKKQKHFTSKKKKHHEGAFQHTSLLRKWKQHFSVGARSANCNVSYMTSWFFISCHQSKL